MSFCIQYQPTPYHHYVLTGLIGQDELLYWFARDVISVVGLHRPSRSLTNVQVRHVAPTLKNTPPHYLKKRVMRHEAAMRLFQMSRVESVQEFGRRLGSDQTYVRILMEWDEKDVSHPTILLILNVPGIPDMVRHPTFFHWFETFKKNAVFKLYPDPLIETMMKCNQDILMNPPVVAESRQVTVLESRQEDACPLEILFEWQGTLKKFKLVEDKNAAAAAAAEKTYTEL